MEKHLDLYRNLKINKSELQQALGEDLHNVECKKAYLIKGNDVANAIRMLQDGEIAVDTLVDWVNIVWFTELYVFDDEEADSIISVFEVLETMDEEDVVVSDDEFTQMIEALTSNSEYTPE